MTNLFVYQKGEWLISIDKLNWVNVREDYRQEGVDGVPYCVVARFIDGAELRLFRGTEEECAEFLHDNVAEQIRGKTR